MRHRTQAVAPPGRPRAKPPRGPASTGTLPAAGPAAAHGSSRFVDNYLGYLLGQANHALFKDFEAAVRNAGLGSLEWRVLATLSEQPPMPVGQLAQEVLSQQPTVTKLLQRLATQDWVSLHGDPSDLRRTLVAITPAGQHKVMPLIDQARRHEAQTLNGLSPADVKRLKMQLRRLAQPG